MPSSIRVEDVQPRVDCGDESVKRCVGDSVRVTATRSLDITPVWAPDSGAIAYTSYRSGYPDIIVQSVRTITEPTKPDTSRL